MINKLTKDQEIELTAHYNEYLNFGRSIEPINHNKVEEIICEFYKLIGKEKPRFLYFSSPLMCILGAEFIKKLKIKNLKINKKLQLELQLGSQLGSQLELQLESQLRSQLELQLRSQLWLQLGSQLGSQLWLQLWLQLGSQLGSQLELQLGSQLRSQLESQLRSQLWSQLRSQLWSQLESQLGSQLELQLESQLWSQLELQYLDNYLAGQQWICWQSFYDFCRKIGCNFKENKLLDLWLEEGKNLHWWFPYDGLVLISERPIRLSVNNVGQLHDENDKAIEYSDGWGFYYLNGVKVPDELVTTPSENLDISFFNKEKNADVRTEFVRKFGVERMLELGKLIDTYQNYDEEWWTKSEYELYDMKTIFNNINYAPHLKMTNQTTGIFHVEAVSPNCRTIKDALKERFGGRDFSIKNIK